MAQHRNARLTVAGRLTLVRRIEQGRPVAHVADEMGISRTTAHRWWSRWQAEGEAGLHDRPSTARSRPHRTCARLEARVVRLRRQHKWGPARIAPHVGLPVSTVHRILVRHGVNRLAWMDRPTGRVVRRYERAVPGELVHMDVKKLGRIPKGGGWRALGEDQGRANRRADRRAGGYDRIHSVVDDHSRLAYSEILADETGSTCAAFYARAHQFFADHGIHIQAVMTDNAFAYTNAVIFRRTLAGLGVKHVRIRPRRPQTNGKVERFNRTLLEEWAYVRTYRSNHARTRAFDRFLHTYNHHRPHTALGGHPPISRVNNAPRHYN
jgi:transposase InsO family protein